MSERAPELSGAPRRPGAMAREDYPQLFSTESPIGLVRLHVVGNLVSSLVKDAINPAPMTFGRGRDFKPSAAVVFSLCPPKRISPAQTAALGASASLV